MPKNLFQEIIFTLIMVVVMVYAMICYNIALDFGELNNTVFVAAFSELWYMGLIAFAFELLIVGPLAKKLAFRIVNPAQQAPIMVTLAISAITVCLMCPVMSLMATLIIKQPSAANFFAVWVQTTAFNFPMALCWQIFFAGPLVRLIFRAIFVYPVRRKNAAKVAEAVDGASLKAVDSVSDNNIAAGAAEEETASAADEIASANSEQND